MPEQHDKIILPANYKELPTPILAKICGQMEARVREIDEQIKDALKKNPGMTPDRFGSVTWHHRARRAQDYYRRDIAYIKEHLISMHYDPGRARRDDDKVNAAFRETARIRLTETLYAGILSEAKERVAEADETNRRKS